MPPWSGCWHSLTKYNSKDMDIKVSEYLYTITNASGASVTLSRIGAAIVSVVVPDKDGKLADVVIGYNDPMD